MLEKEHVDKITMCSSKDFGKQGIKITGCWRSAKIDLKNIHKNSESIYIGKVVNIKF